MTRMVMSVVPTLGVLVGQALAEPYWIPCEGNDFPENEGWTRFWGYTPAERSIEDGTLVIDSRADVRTFDFVYMRRNGMLDPMPGEVFVMQWRLRVDEIIGRVDPTIGLFSDQMWGVGFVFDQDSVFSVFETDVSADFAFGDFHDFELRSHDMRSYELLIDGQLAIEGSFWLSLIPSEVSWGDGVEGGAGLSRWDYFRFGVVPEPGADVLSCACLTILSAKRRTIR